MAAGPLPNSSAVDRGSLKKKKEKVRSTGRNKLSGRKTYHKKMAGRFFPLAVKSKGHTPGEKSPSSILAQDLHT